MSDETRRFDDRVQDYLLSRPGYPRQLLDVLRAAMGTGAPARLSDWRLEWRVADIGAGTGLLSMPFLEAGCQVDAVEPSGPMREAARRLQGRFPGLRVHEGRAEATGLDDDAVDLVVAGQAFHWFDAAAAREEWQRILRPGGVAAAVWNRRHLEGTPFAVAYETFNRTWGIDYAAVSERYESKSDLETVFGAAPEAKALPNRQRLDLAGLLARLRSCSYLPGVDHPRHADMMAAAEKLFSAHAVAGRVELVYDTVVYAGPLG